MNGEKKRKLRLRVVPGAGRGGGQVGLACPPAAQVHLGKITLQNNKGNPQATWAAAAWSPLALPETFRACEGPLRFARGSACALASPPPLSWGIPACALARPWFGPRVRPRHRRRPLGGVLACSACVGCAAADDAAPDLAPSTQRSDRL